MTTAAAATLPPLYAGRTAAFSPEFDTVYGIDADGNIYAPDGLYVPTVEHDDDYDVLIDGNVTRGRYSGSEPRPEWNALTGHTGQHGYSGAVMHPSERWGAWAIDDLTRLADAPDVAYLAFAVVAVEAPCAESDPCYPDAPDLCTDGGCNAPPAGWAVIYREVSA